MKKGLLSILAGALLVVGCQNYDDQFSSLESQINALASTVAGLSQVQSDLSALSGTVGSLSSTVASLGSSIDTAVSNGLADITADIAALQAAVADVASTADVTALQTAIAAAQSDLTELLANSSVYTGNVNITSVSTLDTYHAMGSGLAIVNGNVDIDATVDMDNTKLQAVINAIQVTTGDFDYQAASSAVAAVSFNNLTGTQSLTVKQAGDYSFQKLGSATNVYLYNTWKQSVDKIDFRALTSVTKFYTNSDSGNTINFDKATELHLTKLAYYAPLNLTIVTKKGAAMPFILDDKDINGDQANITLDITGPSPLTISNLTDGNLTFANVAELTVNGFEGIFDINAGVESFTADKVTSEGGSSWLGGATDLETLDITGAYDPDDTDDKTGPVVTIASNSNLETVKVAGKTGAVSLNGNSSLTGVTISADVNGAINIGNSSGNGALTSVTLTGSKATAVNVSNNADLASLTIDTTFRGLSASTTVDGDIDVVDNATLASLTITATAVENLTVTGNDSLTKVDFSKIATDGTTGTPDVDIYDNDLTASFNDTTDTLTTLTGAGQANDLGKVSGSSGIETIKTYLTHIDGATGADIKIAADTVNFTTEANATTEYTWTTNATAVTEYTTNGKTQLFIAYITPNTADAGALATKSKRTFLLDISSGTSTIQITANDVAILDVDGDGAASAIAVANSKQDMLNKFGDAKNIARAATAGVTYSVSGKGNSTVEFVIGSHLDSAVFETSNATVSRLHILTSDVISFTLGNQTVTTAVGKNLLAGDGRSGVSDAAIVAEAIRAKWAAANTASPGLFKWTAAATSAATMSSASGVAIVFTAKDRGTSGFGITPSMSISAGASSTGVSSVVVAKGIGATRSTGDNASDGTDLLLTFEATTAGSLLSEIGVAPTSAASNDAIDANMVAAKIGFTINGTDYNSSGMVTELHSNLLTNAETGLVTSGSTNLYPEDSRSDVRIAEESIAAATSNAVAFNRVGWL